MAVSAFRLRGGGQQHVRRYKTWAVVRTVRALVKWLCALANARCRRAPMRVRHRLEPESGAVCKSPDTQLCNVRLPWMEARSLPGSSTKRRSRVGDEGRRTSSEGLGHRQPWLQNIKGAGDRCHVV
jgi:hypothetical protein